VAQLPLDEWRALAPAVTAVERPGAVG